MNGSKVDFFLSFLSARFSKTGKFSLRLSLFSRNNLQVIVKSILLVIS